MFSEECVSQSVQGGGVRYSLVPGSFQLPGQMSLPGGAGGRVSREVIGYLGVGYSEGE